jgi:hypothetical protein
MARDVTRIVTCSRSAMPGTFSFCLHHLMQADIDNFGQLLHAEIDTIRHWCQSLIASLNNSDCMLVSLGWMGTIWRLPTIFSWKEDPVHARVTHATYSACFKWLTLPRSDEALMDLCRSQCSCTPTQMQFHAHKAGLRMLTVTLAAHPFDALLEHILEPLTLVDSEYSSTQYARRLHTLPRRRMWPRSITSLLPHGPEDTVRAFVRILATDIPPGSREKVYLAFYHMLELCSPLVAPLLIQSSFFVQQATGVMRDLRLKPESHVQDKLDSRHNSKVMACIHAFTSLMGEIVVRSANEAERVAFHGLAPSSILATYAHCIDIYLLAQKLVNVPSTRDHYQQHPPAWLSEVDPTIERLAFIGAKLCVDYPSAAHAQISIAAKELFFEEPHAHRSSPTAKGSELARFLLLMQHLEIRQRCGAPGCVKTRADGRLRCCTGCRRVMYCSRACQKAAWRRAIAHSDVCQAIQLLCVTIGVPEQKILEFVGFEEEKLRTDSSHEGLCHQVLDHFAKLTSYELKSSREGMLLICNRETH